MPEEGSERDLEFKRNRGYLQEVVKGVIARRRKGQGDEHVPFIDNLLQSGVPEDQASTSQPSLPLSLTLFISPSPSLFPLPLWLSPCLLHYLTPPPPSHSMQAINDALAFMIGGFHTSGNFIVWLLWYLSTHPETQERLREELAQETGGERGDRLRAYAKEVSTTYNT